MKAIGYIGGKPLDDPESFTLFEQDTPVPHGRDLLVRVRAVSVNPIDTKVRAGISELQDPPRILGWDAAGIVEEIGENVSLFKPGDRVFYAGDITRPGSNATHQLVDERIVGHHPGTLNFEQAAAMPLTAIAAWEALFSRLRINPETDRDKRILIIGGAGGVGSIAVQLAKKMANLEVIATASREETQQWCRSLGADFTINHYEDMEDQLKQLDGANPDYILCLNSTDQHFSTMTRLIEPQGTICSIVGTTEKHDLESLKSKSAGFVWEFMFTRSMFQTADMITQHELLNKIADLLDSSEIQTTLNNVSGTINPENIRKAHKMLETGRSIGKTVLCDFE